MSFIELFCQEVRELLQSTENPEEIFARCRPMVSGLAQKPLFLKEIFAKYATDDEFLLNRPLTVDPNEVVLFIDPDRRFSLRLYIWDPAVSYPIHAHGSWGVVSCVTGEILERKYQRRDDGSRPGYADIRQVSEAVLRPGGTTVIFPLNQGIHQMGSLSQDSSSISLHLYGKAVRRGYLECFNIHKKTVYRVMSPHLYGSACVLKALGTIREDWAADILETAAMGKRPYLRYEALRALARFDQEKVRQYLETEAIGDAPLNEELGRVI